jgi:hypothetical protein
VRSSGGRLRPARGQGVGERVAVASAPHPPPWVWPPPIVWAAPGAQPPYLPISRRESGLSPKGKGAALDKTGEAVAVRWRTVRGTNHHTAL